VNFKINITYESEFEKIYLQELYETGKTTDKKHHLSSVRINDQYRLEFRKVAALL
jgi:plasmid maintenance system killer protein